MHAPVGYLVAQTANKLGIAIGADGHHDIRFTSVNANGMDASRFGHVQRDRDAPNQFPIPFNDGHAVNGFGRLQHRLEMIRHRVADTFATSNRPDGQRTIFTKVSIPASRTTQKQSSFPAKLKWALGRFFVLFGADIRARNQPDRRTGHLAIQRALDLIVHRAMQGKRVQRLTVVIARRRQGVLHLLKCIKGCSQIGVIRQDNRYRALNIHISGIPYYALVVKEAGRFRCRLKATVPWPTFLWGCWCGIRRRAGRFRPNNDPLLEPIRADKRPTRDHRDHFLIRWFDITRVLEALFEGLSYFVNNDMFGDDIVVDLPVAV
jgi:hypothetical protein